MFKVKIWGALLFFLIGTSLYTSAQKYYSGAIALPLDDIDGVSESVNDMAFWLFKSTGTNYQIQKEARPAASCIQLQWVQSSALSPDVKRQLSRDGQSFYLKVNGTQSALIVGTGTNSFINGIYTFLHELGFRWYMPGDNWAFIPQLNKVNLKLNKVYQPDFQNRNYFGTGGIAPIAGLDPQNTFKRDFDTWNRRNRLSSDYVMKGHTGQVFYRAKQKELDAHPEHFCHNKVNPYGRIDISNPAAVNLFTDWALSQVNPNDSFAVIGVDPADGSGGADDCLPAAMPGIKSWSDKYFWLANKVAEKAAQKGIKAIVQLYAYSSHAAPPGFELKKNVYPVIIPYAFQYVTTPEAFIGLWQEKLKGAPMGMYDYWNITQWSSDLPQFNIYTIPAKLRLWKQSRVNTINLESTNAKGPMGHAFWIATQMMWDTDLSFDKLYDEFLNKCFGPAAPDVKRMYDRWSLRYQGAMDVALSLQNLASASAKVADSDTKGRLAELKAYVHYLKLYYDYQQSPAAPRYQELVRYMYSIHNLRLLQTYALVARYIKKPAGINKPAADSVQPESISYGTIEKNFKNDIAENPVTYTLSDFNFDITKASLSDEAKQKRYSPLHINGPNTYSFYLPASRQLNIQAGATKPTRLVLRDGKGKTWYDNMIPGSAQGYETVRLDLPKGVYTLSFGDYARFSRLVFPENIAFFSSNRSYDNYGYPYQYVYVPKDVNEIVYKDAHGPGLNRRGNWIDPEGKHIQPQLIKYATYRVPVPSQHRGKVWILDIGHQSYELLNIPNVYSLSKFDYNE